MVPRAPSGLLTEQCSYAMCVCVCVCVSTPGRLVVYWVSNTELRAAKGLTSGQRPEQCGLHSERERKRRGRAVMLESMRRLSPHHHFFFFLDAAKDGVWVSYVCAMWRILLILLFFLNCLLGVLRGHHLSSLDCFFNLWRFSVEKKTSAFHVKLLKSLHSFLCVHFINLANEPKHARIKANTLLNYNHMMISHSRSTVTWHMRFI